MIENSEIIAANNQRLADILGHTIPLADDNNKSKTALDDQDIAVTDLEKVFQGLPVDGPKCTNVSDTTATSGDVATGKIFYDKDGVRTIGTLSNTYITVASENDLPSDAPDGTIAIVED